MEADFAPMIEDEGTEASMDELLCPICLDLLHRPHSLQPCQHLFCDPCLRRLAGARIHKCPVCRSPIEDCHLDQELHDSIEDQHQDAYIQREEAEMASGIYNEPLPPVRGTVVEIFNELTRWFLLAAFLYLLLLAILTLTAAMFNLMDLIESGVILMLNPIYDQTEAFLDFLSLRPIMVLTKLILRPMAMIIQFPEEYFQWLRSFSSCSW